MKRRHLLGMLFAFLALPTLAVAQDQQYETGALVQVMTFEVEPSHAPQFETTMAQVVEAAKQANLAENFAWSVWSNGFTYALVYPVPNMAYFDDEQQWMREFAGTAGEATLTEAFQALESIDAKVTNSEVLEAPPSWSFVPEGTNPYGLTNASVFDVWLKPGQATMAKFDQLAKQYIGLLGEIGFPYMVMGNRVRFGDVGRVEFVTLFDNLANYHGMNNLEKMIEAKGMQAKWDEIGAQFIQLVERTEESFYTLKPNMTYQPAGSPTESGAN